MGEKVVRSCQKEFRVLMGFPEIPSVLTPKRRKNTPLTLWRNANPYSLRFTGSCERNVKATDDSHPSHFLVSTKWAFEYGDSGSEPEYNAVGTSGQRVR